ncbi:uncharacterized protein [Salminus brasiliensis]|uniref:uncharacterized protein isoform X2 n=1 Tax=Salminus brasiliensis TaxID=930266 RepID=UPI003B8311F7
MLLRVSLLLALSPLWFTWGEVPLKVCCVENPTYTEEYRCISNGDAAVTNYTWYKQDQKGLPEGVMAEGDTLHFLKWTYDISGTYICVAINQKGVNSASFYTYIQKREECFCSWILKKVLGLWTLLKLPHGFSQSPQC